MSETERTNLILTGTVRVDERIPRLCARLEPSEIAVIEAPDLDRSSAMSLLSRRPLAVLNVSSSTTGRKPSFGAQLLAENGIVVIDDLGSELMVLSEGENIEVRGNEIYRNEQLIAVGTKRNLEELQGQLGSGRNRLEVGVEGLAQGAALLWQRESGLLLEGEGIPKFQDQTLKNRTTALVIVPGQETDKQMSKLRRFVRDFTPIVIVADEAANTIGTLRRKPDVLIGDMSNVSEKMLRSGAQIILLERPDGSIPGLERVSNYGLNYSLMPTSSSAADAAILLADNNGSQDIVTLGTPSGIEEFLGQNGSELTSGFFVRLRCEKKIVSSQVALKLYRPQISNWQLAFMLLAALLVLVAAILFTPWGQDAGFLVTDWVSGLWSSSATVGYQPDGMATTMLIV